MCKRLFAALSLLAIWLVLPTGCVRRGATGVEPVEQDPTIITGTNIRGLAPSCAVVNSDRLHQEISCRVVRQTSVGEVVVTEVSPDLAINWSSPKLISGSRFMITNERTLQNGLQFEASLELESNNVTHVEFAFVSSAAGTTPVRAAQTITIPFSVRTYGVSVQMRDVFDITGAQPATPRAIDAGIRASQSEGISPPIPGFIPSTFAADKLPFYLEPAQDSHLCQLRGRLYISTFQNIYVVENGRARLFAGNVNATPAYSGTTEFSDASAISLGGAPGIVCREGAQPEEDRIYAAFTPVRVFKSTPQSPHYPLYVAVIRPNGSGQVVVAPSAIRMTGVSSAAFDREGELYIMSFAHGALVLCKMTRAGTFSLLNLETASAEELATITNKAYDYGSLAIDAQNRIFIGIAQRYSIYRFELSPTSPLTGRLVRVVGDGTMRASATLAGNQLTRVGGLAFLADGGLAIAEPDTHQLLRYDFVAQSVGLLYRDPAVKTPNSLARYQDHLLLGFTSNLYQGGSAVAQLEAPYTSASFTIKAESHFSHLQDGDDFRAKTSLPTTVGADSDTEKKPRGVRYLRYRGSDICLMEASTGRLICVDNRGKVQTVVGSDTTAAVTIPPYTETPLPKTTRIFQPVAFAFGPDGSVFFTLYSRQVVLKYEATTQTVRVIAGIDANTPRGPSPLDANYLNQHPGELSGPRAIEVDSNGTVYFTDDYLVPGSLRVAYLKKLTPQTNGSYQASVLMGTATTDSAPVASLPVSQLPISDLRVLGPDHLLLSYKARSLSDYLNAGGSGSGALYRWQNERLTLLAGGESANRDAASGPALKTKISPEFIDLARAGVIYFQDSKKAIRRLLPQTDGSYLVDTMVSGSENGPRCGGGIRSGTAEASVAERTWMATLNTICIGDSQGIAVRDTCGTANATDFTLFFSQEFDAGLGNSVLVEAKRGCL